MLEELTILRAVYSVVFALRSSFLLWTACLMVASHGLALAQSILPPLDFDPVTNFELGLGEQSGLTKVIVADLEPVGVGLSVADRASAILGQTLRNFGRFVVIDSDEVNQTVENIKPYLVDCRQLYCAVEAGRDLEVDWVVVGRISSVGNQLSLDIEVVEVESNSVIFSDASIFDTSEMGESIFQTATFITSYTPLGGKIVGVLGNRTIINLGTKQGITEGAELVVTEQQSEALLDGNTTSLKKVVAVIRVVVANQFVSECIVLYKYKEPVENYDVVTYIASEKQTELVSKARREIDTLSRIAVATAIEPQPLLRNGVNIEEWQDELDSAILRKNIWLSVAISSAAAGIYFATQSANSIAMPILAGSMAGLLGYSIYDYVTTNARVEELQAEGRIRGYIGVMPQGFSITLASRF